MTPLEPAMFELFREEVRGHAAALSSGLVELEGDPGNPEMIEPLMRAAHSIKGAARIAGSDAAVQVAHVLEDALVAAQAGRLRLLPAHIDSFLQAADLLAGLAELADGNALLQWDERNRDAAATFEPRLNASGARDFEPVIVVEQGRALHANIEAAIPPAPPRSNEPIPRTPIPLGDEHGMHDLFREELRSNLMILAAGIDAPTEETLDAIRQLRGSARLMMFPAMDSALATVGECLRAVHLSKLPTPSAAMGWLHHALDLLATGIPVEEDLAKWAAGLEPKLNPVIAVLSRVKPPPAAPEPEPAKPALVVPKPQPPTQDGVVRVTAHSLNRLMGLAGESLVQARWLNAFSTSLDKLKKQHEHLAELLDSSMHAAASGRSADQIATLVAETRQQASRCRTELSETGSEFDEHAARAENLNTRLYREVIASRMRPFADGLLGLARTVRDMARSLGKQARLEVIGEATDVDRDVLEKLEALSPT